jgi:hypothetical protein
MDEKTRKKLIVLLKGTNYRKVVSERADCHPNTVTNVLNNSDPQLPNDKVELELLIFAKEVADQKQQQAANRKKALAIAKQL